MGLDEISKNVINATISTEDKNFYKHKGFDLFRILKATYINISSRKTKQGASTITQQYAKNLFLDFDKTWKRKWDEALYTIRLEANYSKDEILALYVNSSYFGDGYYCIYDASMGYFNKEPKDLNLEEASMLAGVPNAPSVYSPTVNPDLAKKRQSHVLNKMVEYGYITQEEANTIL